MTDGLDEHLIAALRTRPKWSVPNLLHWVRDPKAEWIGRRSAYEFLVRQEVWEVGDLFLQELLGDGDKGDPFQENEIRIVADLLESWGSEGSEAIRRNPGWVEVKPESADFTSLTCDGSGI